MVTATAPAPTRKELVTGGDPEAAFVAPAEDSFVDEQGLAIEYKPASDIAKIAKSLIKEKPALKPIAWLSITYLWKKRGGKSRGQETLGKLERPGTLTRHFGAGAFVLWLAADHLRDAPLTAYQVEALIYSRLLYADINDKGQPTLAAPDFVGFAQEIEEYGLWRPEHRTVADAFQARLFTEPDR